MHTTHKQNILETRTIYDPKSRTIYMIQSHEIYICHMHMTHKRSISESLYMAIQKLYADLSAKAHVSREIWVTHYIYVVCIGHTNYISITNYTRPYNLGHPRTKPELQTMYCDINLMLFCRQRYIEVTNYEFHTIYIYFVCIGHTKHIRVTNYIWRSTKYLLIGRPRYLYTWVTGLIWVTNPE